MIVVIVSSIVLYAAPIWSLRHIDELEKIQNIFYRKLLSLPRNTPGYSIRADTGIERIEVVLFSLVLNFIQRILEMPEYRLPKICLKRLLQLSKNNVKDEKYNWITQLKNKFFYKINRVEFIDSITLETLVKEKESLINDYKKYTQAIDKREINNSSCLTVFSIFNETESKINYLNLKIPISHKKILAQLRMLNKYNPRIITKDRINITKTGEYCNYCGDENTIFHSIRHCEQYKKDRENLIPEILNSEMENSIFYFVNNLNDTQARKMVNFIHIILNEQNKMT